jgi:hypothetical protein
MIVALAFSIAAYFHAFGNTLSAWSPFLALAIAMILSPVLSVLLRRKSLYIAREPSVPPAEWSAVQVRCRVCDQATRFGHGRVPVPLRDDLLALLHAREVMPGRVQDGGGRGSGR